MTPRMSSVDFRAHIARLNSMFSFEGTMLDVMEIFNCYCANSLLGDRTHDEYRRALCYRITAQIGSRSRHWFHIYDKRLTLTCIHYMHNCNIFE